MTGTGIASKVGRLEDRLSDLERKMSERKAQITSLQRNRSVGAGAVLIGMLGFLFFHPLWALWVLLGVAGVLTLVTALVKLSSANAEVAEIRREIRETRDNLAADRRELDKALGMTSD
jgi:Flp pilus assembly protein TadB